MLHEKDQNTERQLENHVHV